MSVNQNDTFQLERFISAQQGVYDQVLSELKAGRKQSHWIWFIFPQIKGLGYSPTSIKFAIQTLDEARAYLSHPVLGDRLIECTKLVLAIDNRSVSEIFGYPDDLKFKSSMTLFSAVSDKSVFREALAKFFDDEADENTLKILKISNQSFMANE